MTTEKNIHPLFDMLESAKVRADELQNEADDYPLRTAITIRIIMIRLGRIQAVPTSFTNQIEREKAHLVWRKLQNIYDRCEAQLSPDEKSQINPAITASINLDFIKDVSRKIGPYRQYNHLCDQIKTARAKNEKMSRIQLCAFVVPTFIVGFAAVVFANNVTETNMAIVLILIQAYFVVVLAGMFIPASKKDKRLPALLHQLNRVEKTSNVKDKEYWKYVQEKLGGIPSNDEIMQFATAQTAILDPIYKPGVSENECNSIIEDSEEESET